MSYVNNCKSTNYNKMGLLNGKHWLTAKNPYIKGFQRFLISTFVPFICSISVQNGAFWY
jgi:hypothetical protein